MVVVVVVVVVGTAHAVSRSSPNIVPSVAGRTHSHAPVHSLPFNRTSQFVPFHTNLHTPHGGLLVVVVVGVPVSQHARPISVWSAGPLLGASVGTLMHPHPDGHEFVSSTQEFVPAVYLHQHRCEPFVMFGHVTQQSPQSRSTVTPSQ